MIFTEPIFEGNTVMKVFDEDNSTFVGTITTNATDFTLLEGHSYIIQIIPTGTNFINDPYAFFDYVERGAPIILISTIILFLIFFVVGVAAITLYGNRGRRR